MNSHTRQVDYAGWLILSLSVLLTAGVFVYFASQLDIQNTGLAYDWRIIWGAIERGNVEWGTGLYNPPWGVLFLLPLGFLSFSVSWGLVIFLTLAVLILSVPQHYRKRIHLLSIVLLVTCFPAMKNYAEANVEFLTIGGILLTLFAYRNDKPYLLAIGAIMATVKPQAVVLLMIVIGWYLLTEKSREFTLKFSTMTLAIVVPSMLWGGEAWIESLTSGRLTYGISIEMVLGETSLILTRLAQLSLLLATGWIIWRANRDLDRYKVGLLVAASLLVAPYTNAHSMITMAAIGVAALAVYHPRIGIPLFLFYHVPFITLTDVERFDPYLPDYWATVLFITWMALAYQVTTRPIKD